MNSWPLSVRLSVCPVPQPKSRIQGLSNLKIGRKKAHDKWSVTPFRDRNVVGQGNQANKRRYRKSAISSEREGLRTSNFVHGWSTMTRITDMRGNLQIESSGWLFKSPLAEGTCTCGGRTTYWHCTACICLRRRYYRIVKYFQKWVFSATHTSR